MRDFRTAMQESADRLRRELECSDGFWARLETPEGRDAIRREWNETHGAEVPMEEVSHEDSD